MVLEDLLDALARRALDLIVGVHERQAEARGETAPDGGLAATGHADQNDRPAAEAPADPLLQALRGLVGFASRRESHHCSWFPPDDIPASDSLCRVWLQIKALPFCRRWIADASST
jgi:hypothetical protein